MSNTALANPSQTEWADAFSYYRSLAIHATNDELEHVALANAPTAIDLAARDAAVEELSKRARSAA